MKMKKDTFIYSLNDPLTNVPMYIGKSDYPNIRLTTHLRCNGNNKKTNWIKSLNKKSLTPKLEILDKIQKDTWKFWEKHYISLYKSWGFELKNGSVGGEGVDEITAWKISKANKGKVSSFKGKKHSQETKEKLSMAHKGRVAWNKGKKLSKEHIEKLIKSHKGIIPSKETRKKLSDSMIKRIKLGQKFGAKVGHIVSSETREKIRNSNKGKTVSQEQRNKIRKALIGKKMPEEIKSKISKSMKRFFSSNNKI